MTVRRLLLVLMLAVAAPAAATGPVPPSPEADRGPDAGVTFTPDVAPAPLLPMERAASMAAAPTSKGVLTAEPFVRTGEGGQHAAPSPDPTPPTPAPEPEPAIEPADAAATDGIDAHWLELARCESGNWHDGGASFSGPIRWDAGAPDAEPIPWDSGIHHGGLQHAPQTWEWVAGDLGLLEQYPYAYDAPPDVQVKVATEVQARQGWGAWPVCSKKVGLR